MRRSLILMVLFLAGALATYGYVTREPVDASPASQELAATTTTATAEPRTVAPQTIEAAQTIVTAQPMAPAENSSAVGLAPRPEATAGHAEDRVGKWIAETSSSDPGTRADAIVALGDAPRARALPALVEVVNAADSVDVPLAMGSLKKLAINQGDADERIRSVVRKVIYHGNDDALTSVAQTTLNDIEVDLSTADAGTARR